MNKSKISPKLLKQVSALGTKSSDTVFLTCENFNKTKSFLKENNYNFLPYRFANCISLEADVEDINILSNQEFIKYISPVDLVSTLRKEDDFLHLDNLTENKFLGQGQTICFIDTGIYPHFDFVFPKSRIIKFIDLINQLSSPYDDNGHGSFVAGIACGAGILNGEFLGFSPRANIISIKALGWQGNSNSNVILDAMQWVYENYKALKIGIVCMSFGAESDINLDPLSNGAEALWKSGITVVAAAGNSGPENNTIKSPGNNPYIITVGGIDTSNLQVANFSSRGPTIYGHKPDLLAPAVNITACSNEASRPYTIMSGTSVATPIVAGICADIKSKWKNITNSQIKTFLTNNCTKLTGDIDSEGAGYLDFQKYE